jgi:hypothetical protein
MEIKTEQKKEHIKFYDAHPEKKIKEICPICQGSYNYFNKSHHTKTKRHIQYKKFLNEIELLKKTGREN